jgi:hypothetical protein
MSYALANILSAFDPKTIGSKVTDKALFSSVLESAIEAHDFSTGDVPGQAFIMLPDAAKAAVSAGVGPRSENPDDYVCREHRGRVGAFLRRERAASVDGVAAIVYTREAYLGDPDVDEAEGFRVQHASHVLVAVLAFAGPKAPLPVFRLVANLAGGNKAALVWDADRIRSEAKAAHDYDADWSVVAD